VRISTRAPDGRPVPARAAAAIASWVLFAHLDLGPFYHSARQHPVLGPLVRRFRGLKPMRPASVFEMAVVAITEQQSSLAAAHTIRYRLVARFGETVEDSLVFPTAERLARATLGQLAAVGLSRAKAGYVQGLARAVASGALDLDALVTLDDEAARARLLDVRGFGPWSVEYVLVRGLARPDCVPVEDIGIRSVVGSALGRGRASPGQVQRFLAPFQPWRGLAAFYLLANARADPAQR